MAIRFTSTTQNARILSIGAYRPPRVVPNSELVDRIESSDEWIQQRTGIQTRHWAAADESVADMAVKAATIAIARAGITPQEIDTIIFATITYPYQPPSASTEVAQRLEIKGAAAFDIGAACAGFSYGLGLANDMIRSGSAKFVLVIGAEKISDFIDLDDRATSFIFADGAGAAVVGLLKSALVQRLWDQMSKIAMQLPWFPLGLITSPVQISPIWHGRSSTKKDRRSFAGRSMKWQRLAKKSSRTQVSPRVISPHLFRIRQMSGSSTL
jgi:3-oxoacyl-[acyl-carrier-protein] synthase III